jgi:hypothetical protein
MVVGAAGAAFASPLAFIGSMALLLYRPPAIPDDLPGLEELIVAEDAVLVVVDPLMAFLSCETDSYRDQPRAERRIIDRCESDE